MHKRLFTSILLVVVLTVVALAALPALAQQGSSGRLSKRERELLAEARADGANAVVVLIASLPGANTTVAAGLAQLGATVRYREDSID